MVLAYRYLKLNSQGLSLLHPPPIVCLGPNENKKSKFSRYDTHPRVTIKCDMSYWILSYYERHSYSLSKMIKTTKKKYHIAKLIIGFDVNTVLFDELLVPNL